MTAEPNKDLQIRIAALQEANKDLLTALRWKLGLIPIVPTEAQQASIRRALQLAGKK